MTAPKGAGGGFTPGPWTVERGSFGVGRYIAGPDGVAIARMASNTTPEMMSRERAGIHEANARLIAAAPRMYDFVRRAADAGDTEALAILEAAHGRS